MEKNEIENLKNLKKLAASYLKSVGPISSETQAFVTKIRMQSYYELGYAITDLLRLCILSLEEEEHKKATDRKSSINVVIILEMVIQLFPMEEFEFLSELHQQIFTDSNTLNE
ncbi:hypothetical protein [Flavobacterium sp. CLA17]|uniref:hypothetical protein n=1 Tax=Flavobacterium sp. CLA17 TaxID=2724135 RepID=UPI001490CAD6|nr:hypothetical protein [Flavobacterium sp. CLA17]QSB25464.1 hypothetical protein HAV12_013895 [Flavobacterium sp. CLA17]